MQVADPNKQETLECENPIDDMDTEQTFPTVEELEEAEKQAKTIKKRVPKGTSDYQVRATYTLLYTKLSISYVLPSCPNC